MNKILSIIVPTYNMEKYLERCLSSLIVDAENMRKIEVLVINDGSTDQSSAIAHQFAEQYPDTFIVVDKENGHYGSCVNRGLSMATGKYVKVLDADDWFNTTEFSRYIQVLARVDVDVVFSRYAVQTDGKLWESPHCNTPENIELNISKLSPEIIDNTHQSIAYRTVFLKSFGYKQTEGIPYTDTEWYVFPMSRVSNFSVFSGIVYLYNRDRMDQSMDPSIHIKSLGVNRDIVLKVVEFYEQNKTLVAKDNRKLLFTITSSEVNFIYKCALLKYGKQVKEDFLQSFDANLLTISPEMYNSVESAYEKRKFGTLYYVRQWRKRRSRNTLAFAYYDIGMKVGAIAASLRK